MARAKTFVCQSCGAATAKWAGRCESCNHCKEAPGWRARPRGRPGERHLIEITTPTGHTYRSHAPPLPGTPQRISKRTTLDVQFPRLLIDVA